MDWRDRATRVHSSPTLFLELIRNYMLEVDLNLTVSDSHIRPFREVQTLLL